MMNCKHQSRKVNYGPFACALGLYGGRPYLGNCVACIKSNQNNEEYVKTLRERELISHPPTAKRASGCCDSALNP
jgi:hypothetical protein